MFCVTSHTHTHQPTYTRKLIHANRLDYKYVLSIAQIDIYIYISDEKGPQL